jgi:hypothetical protein
MNTVSLHAATHQAPVPDDRAVPGTPSGATPPSAITLTRWMRLIEQHGGPTRALEALLRDADKLERLLHAVRSCGIDPDELLGQNVPGPRPR